MIFVRSIGRKRTVAAEQKNDRRLETFTPVDGHDLNGGTVAFETLNIAVFAPGLTRSQAVRGERRDQVSQVTAGGTRFLEQHLEDVQVICERAFVIFQE